MSDQGTSNIYRHLGEGTSQSSTGSTTDSEGIFVFKANATEPFPPKKRGWFSRGHKERMKRLRRAQQQAMTARNAQNPEARPLWEEELDRQLANVHLYGGEPNFHQAANPQPQLLPLFPDQPMNLDHNQGNQFPIPAFDPNMEPRIPAPNLQNLWWANNWEIQQLLENPIPYEEPVPPYPEPVPAPVLPMEHVEELRQLGDELVEEGNRIRQIGEKLVWKYDEREMQY